MSATSASAMGFAEMEDVSNGLEERAIPCKPNVEKSLGLAHPATFRYVKRNIPGPGCDMRLFEDQLCGCDCVQSCQEETCPCLKRFGPNYVPKTGQLTPAAVSSSNQQPIFECNSQCACSSACSNRLVQHGPGVRLTVAPSSSKGLGLFAGEQIMQLTFVCEYAGEVISVAEAGRRLKRKNNDMNYLIVLREHCQMGVVFTCVDPQHMGNVGRFANHSCDGNLLMVPVRVDSSIPRLALFARRDIAAGEELCFDYSGETTFLHSQSVTDASQRLLCDKDNSRENDLENDPMSQNNTCSVQESKEKLQKWDNGQRCVCQPDGCNSNVSGSSCIVRDRDQSEAALSDLSDEKTVCECNQVESSLSSPELCISDMSGRKRLSSETDLKVEPKRKHPTLSEETAKMSGTKCLCNSPLCKGYLPFDEYIFNS